MTGNKITHDKFASTNIAASPAEVEKRVVWQKIFWEKYAKYFQFQDIKMFLQEITNFVTFNRLC